LHEYDEDEESQLNIGLAHLDDLFATSSSGELPRSDYSDLDWDVPPSDSANINGIRVSHLNPSLLVSPPTDQGIADIALGGQCDGPDDDDFGYETDSSSLPDNIFATAGELLSCDSDTGDSSYGAAPEVEPHDLYTNRSTATISTNSQNGSEPDLEDIFADYEEYLNAESLLRSCGSLPLQNLSLPSQVIGNEFNPQSCSPPKEDISESGSRFYCLTHGINK
jgi:hypothetical protein